MKARISPFSFISGLNKGRTLIFCCLLSCCALNAQYVTIPDTVFASWLNTNGYSSCMNGNKLDTTCSAVLNATVMNCNYVPIRDLGGIQYFKNLTYLDCSGDSLYTLPSLPNSLDTIMCQHNNLSSLPVLPGALQTLWCYNNQLTSLPTLPFLLKSLYCGDNPLNSLPTLPLALTRLDCSYAALIALPVLPTNLEYLWCNNNRLSALPVLPADLMYLNCGGNQLSSLPSLPDSLQTLMSENNQLISLPDLPANLTTLWCDYNQLTVIPTLPDSLVIFFCSYNTNLHCLPELKRIVSLDFRGTAVTCLLNYGNVNYSYPPLNTVPLCDSNGCQAYSSITVIKQMNLSIYPNPATTYAELATTYENGTSILGVMDITGREILQIRLLHNPYILPLDNIPPGVYLVKVTNADDGQSLISKLVKP